jgi:hypothetical protein
MSGVMKNRKNNVLPFPRPPEEEPRRSKIIAHIGSQSFAIHMWTEDLPSGTGGDDVEAKDRKNPFELVK